MKCRLNAGKWRKRRQLEAATRDDSCQRQQQQQPKQQQQQQQQQLVAGICVEARKQLLVLLSLLLLLVLAVEHANATTAAAATSTAATATATTSSSSSTTTATTTSSSKQASANETGTGATSAAAATSSSTLPNSVTGASAAAAAAAVALGNPFKNILRIGDGNIVSRTAIEQSLVTIHDIATENLGTLCISTLYRPLQVPINSERFESSRQKADLAASILQEVGIIRHGGLSDALAKGLLTDEYINGARILALNLTNGAVQSYVWWVKSNSDNNNNKLQASETQRYEEESLQIGKKPAHSYPWFDDESSTPTLRSPKFAPSPPNNYYKGWWTYPYFSCAVSKWLVSYSIAIPPSGRHGLRGFISVDIDVTSLRVNQCDAIPYRFSSQQLLLRQRQPARRSTIASAAAAATANNNNNDVDTINDLQAFHSSHKCHRASMVCDYRQPSAETPTISSGKILAGMSSSSWSRGAYQCLCKRGFYSLRHPDGFNGTIMEIAWQEHQDNISNYYSEVFKCYPCAPGCDTCTGPEPCLANYHWPFRISLLTISIGCACGTFVLAGYLFRHRRVKVFKVASPIFLMITLIGCAIMYLEMVAIFPYLDTSWCIATKWTRHMGFCITYTSLLMKTWRVSLTYRVKSAHKIKLNDQQLLQWMVPILLVMLIYLGTWTISATPYAEVIYDQHHLKFKQCSYNWWDHSLAIGEVFFLAWGIRVCYNVRNAESLYNEARLISYAIYNIAIVNIAMVAFHVMLFPHAGPDYKYMLGFVRTQLSTTTTIALVFGPKIARVFKGQGDKWDQKAKVRSITASFSLNGVGLVPEESPDLYQENEELKEQIQKLAHQIEFMKTVHMQMNNRHLKPKPGGYFTITSTSFQAPYSKSSVSTAQTQTGGKDDFSCLSGNATPSKCKSPKGKV
ncbi:probable G-protein coupled receptor CG31760 [Drosophila nasuta]|uniref:probable G-protein coupled receptor CG31760 n=1 Tax=Drosophila nasuta TaxID=42062 RepID=UPI00295EC429|nr:probable G-protein coupled receptor CG31760 [Drosophila nasuta]